ncbi:MAG: 16S rRNA (cytosine(1402)-N(4))-methyltransferase RsmH [bacterium]|nr:16S rRNA (cytosine(1402)-N(4))-methyltransferase RsmH [bacterium]
MERMHTPVMAKDALSFLDPKPGKIYIDCTIGAGGHSETLLKLGSKVIGIDQDAEVLEIARERLSIYGDKIIFIHENFRNLDSILNELNIQQVDGIIYDLGVSTYQLNKAERGFSFQKDGPLDMRMDKERKTKAYDLVNHLSEKELSEIIWAYGEDKWAKRIAKQIIFFRQKEGSISTTSKLVKIIKTVVPKKSSIKIHPATRTFQAFRIAVNNELSSLEKSLEKAKSFLSKDGKIIVISFHSLEDRIVKNKFKEWEKMHPPLVKVLSKKPFIPTLEEIKINPRARSAKFRVAQKSIGG